jgi:hypothetical protein
MRLTCWHEVRRVEDLVIFVREIDRRREIGCPHHESVDLLDRVLHDKVVAFARRRILSGEALRDEFRPVGRDPAFDSSLELCSEGRVLFLVPLDEIIPSRHPAVASCWDFCVELFDLLWDVVFFRGVPAICLLHLNHVFGPERCTMRACLAGFGAADADDAADVDEEWF